MVTHSPYPEVPIPSTDLWKFLFQRQNRPFPDSKVILTDTTTHRSYTFSNIRTLSSNLGSSLQQKWNWQKGDLLTLVLPNSIDLPLIAWGTISIGGVVSPLNLATAGNGLAHYLKDSGSKAVITQRAQYQVVSKAAQEAGLGKSRVVALEDINQDMWLPDTSDARPQGSESPPIPDPAHETAFLVYSSGTSGLPKGVMLSHTNIVANMIQTLSVDSGALTSRDTTLAFLPMSHIMGIFVINYALFLGMTTVIMPRFNLEEVCSAIQKYKITYSYIVPPVLLQLVQNPLVARYNLSSIRMFTSAGSPISPELIHRARNKLSLPVRQSYGMSECSPCTHLQTWEEGTEFPGAVGRLLPNMRAKYVSVDGETVSPGKQGELWVKGPNVFLGYLGNKKASEEAFSADGFYKTGDVGYEDCRGQLFITDRVKELIKYNTFQIAPAELEGLLLGHSAVADVAVVGVPSGQVGSEHARAYVVAKDKERATEQTARDIEEFVREKVVHYKRLRGGVRFVDEIPRNPSGKILKRELKERRCSRL